MGSKEKPLFDLNELPDEVDEEIDGISCFQPQRAIPSSNSHTPDLFTTSPGPQRIINNKAFSHAASVSGFQPFRPKTVQQSLVVPEQMRDGDMSSEVASLSKRTHRNDTKAERSINFHSKETQPVEKEEGEWSDAEGSADAHRNSNIDKQSLTGNGNVSLEKGMINQLNSHSGSNVENLSRDDERAKDENCRHSSRLDVVTNDRKSSSLQNLEGKGDLNMLSSEDSACVTKQREVKGVEASHALKFASNPGKRPKFDHQKEVMLGKKRSRQTMYINLEDVKQVGATKTSTPKRPNVPAVITTRTVKDARSVPPAESIVEKQGQLLNKDHNQVDLSCTEGNNYVESSDSKSESNGDMNSGLLGKSRRLNSASDLTAEVQQSSLPSQKQSTDLRQLRNTHVSSRKLAPSSQNQMDTRLGNKKFPPKKLTTVNNQYNQYQDTSVERLLREVTNEKFWQHPEDTDLQRVPGRFDSVEEYVRVFEPLLFEECRAQLYSTWEEQTETFSRDSHAMVYVKSVERRERGWYDVIVLPVNANECKWTFKEGDVAVLSTPKPGTVRHKRSIPGTTDIDEELEFSGRVAGTVRRYFPVDTRNHPGAILHFYVGDTYDPNSKSENEHIVRKLQRRDKDQRWYLTVLGSLATTQREYVALHAFRQLNMQMQSAILQPSSDYFPKYEEPPPAMPECFTPNFVDYLHKNFNAPQLAAIQWAAMHTAAGTSSSGAGGKKQDPWPFTLVQGPPGTGKTHTVWGMLNVIHLVQYQHYYTALLKKLAPESYMQASEGSSADNIPVGSIDAVLQNMDKDLFRTLPKLCPKPRMLVCAPSNAATDELLSRVLGRGFIDGEMKIYRPDVARVGVDSQTRAAQAVSVERRTEQLLCKSRDEVYGWMNQLRAREAQLSQQMACLQRELTVAANAGRAQGSVGVDPDVLVARDQNRDTLLQNLAAVVENRDKVLVEMSRLWIVEGKFSCVGSFNLEEARSSLEASFANEAEIVFTTVSSSGRKLFSRLTHGFDMVVIDEAAQASEVGVLPPLALGAARCVLVGDPQQLPATVISKAAGTLLYSRSLFERFQQAGCPTMLLSVQYRMHPQIRDFPSRYFYQGRLTDSESIVNLPDEPYYKDSLLQPYVFYDITHGRESQDGKYVSYQNVSEAQFCLRLYEHLQKTVKSMGLPKVTVGIITPYKLQLKCLQREFVDVLNSEDGKDIYINTVDAFQGQERDVIIMSCVRASGHGVGFVADIRRMNVALTRARRALWVMGNASALVKSDDWKSLISDAKARKCFRDMDSLPKDFFVTKFPPYAPPLPGRASSNYNNNNNRGLRPSSGGVRHR